MASAGCAYCDSNLSVPNIGLINFNTFWFLIFGTTTTLSTTILLKLDRQDYPLEILAVLLFSLFLYVTIISLDHLLFIFKVSELCLIRYKKRCCDLLSYSFIFSFKHCDLQYF